MTSTQAAAPTAKTIRLIHAALIIGVLLFGVVAHFVMRPNASSSDEFPAGVQRLFLGLAIVTGVVSLLLRRVVPRRRSDQSADAFWSKAAAPALATWAPLEGAGLLGVILYANAGSVSGIGVAAVAIVLLFILRPGSLERL